MAYYRLKQTDFDGRFEYHRVVASQCEITNKMSIYPNPFNNAFNVQLSGKQSSLLMLEIHDYLGRIVYSQSIDTNTTEIIIGKDLPPGTYFVKVFNETTQIIEKVIKMK